VDVGFGELGEEGEGFLPAEVAAVAEVGEGHVIASADGGVDFVDLAGEAVRGEPFAHGVSVDEGFVEVGGGGAEDAVESDGAGHGEFLVGGVFDRGRSVSPVFGGEAMREGFLKFSPRA